MQIFIWICPVNLCHPCQTVWQSFLDLLPALLTRPYVCYVSVVHLDCPSVCLFVRLHYFWHTSEQPRLHSSAVTLWCLCFVFAIPVCLDPCDPVDCGNSVPPCHSEPVWRNDLVSRTQTDQRDMPRCLWRIAAHVSSQVCSHCCGALHTV